MIRPKTVLTMLIWMGAIVLGTVVRAQDSPGTVRVPEGRPILTDGVFSPGEWDDALAIRVRPDLQLLLKKNAGFVFIGLKYTRSAAPSSISSSPGTARRLPTSTSLPSSASAFSRAPAPRTARLGSSGAQHRIGTPTRSAGTQARSRRS